MVQNKRIFKKNSKYAINMDRTKKIFISTYNKESDIEAKEESAFLGGVIFTLFFAILATFFYSQMWL